MAWRGVVLGGVVGRSLMLLAHVQVEVAMVVYTIGARCIGP
jgi:hypothetical protein